MSRTKISAYPHKGNPKQYKHPAMRWLFLFLGGLFFVLGVIGAVMPVLPTVPFILLAAACWARGSERFYLWLINHRHLGHHVRHWEAHRAVPKRAKWLACVMMAISTTFLFIITPVSRIWVAWLVLATCISVAIYLSRLPNSPPK